MKRQILLATVTVTLIMSGCAQKKMNTVDGSGAIPNATPEVFSGAGDNTNVYQNVDPMGQGNGQFGTGAGYGEDDSYANSGVQNIYFDVDQYSITADKLGQISHNATLLRPKATAGARVKIEGHCDASGSDEYNYALGLRRAKAAKDALVSNGVNSRAITLVSMGESAPECMSSTSSECYAKNRRVEFKVTQ